jgi:hypothetical protein
VKREFINKVMMLPFARENLPGLVELKATLGHVSPPIDNPAFHP